MDDFSLIKDQEFLQNVWRKYFPNPRPNPNIAGLSADLNVYVHGSFETSLSLPVNFIPVAVKKHKSIFSYLE